MSEHEVIDEGAAEDRGGRSRQDRSSGDAPPAATSHQHASDSPPVLARMPNLESDHPEPDRQTPLRRGREGRLLGSKWALRLLVGAAVSLVLLAVLPLVLDKKGAGDSSSKDDSSSWRPEVPAPSAPLAAPWTGSSGESSGSGASQSVTVPTTAWSEGAQAVERPQQPDISSWRDPGQWPYGGTEQRQASPSAEVTRSQPAVTESAAAAADTPAPYERRYQASRPAPGYRDDYRRAQAGTNRPMAIDQPGPTDTSRYGGGYRQTDPSALGVDAGTAPPVRSPQADAGIAPSVTSRRYDRYAGRPPYDSRSGYRQAANPSGYRADGRYDGRAVSPRYGYHSQTDYRDRTQDPPSTSRYPTSEYPTDRYPAYRYPRTDYSTDRYPAATSLEPYPTSEYGAAGAAPSGEPGVARLQGVIERPAVNTNNTSDRPSLY